MSAGEGIANLGVFLMGKWTTGNVLNYKILFKTSFRNLYRITLHSEKKITIKKSSFGKNKNNLKKYTLFKSIVRKMHLFISKCREVNLRFNGIVGNVAELQSSRITPMQRNYTDSRNFLVEAKQKIN